ncbi:MAG: Holliday junction branch migration protein RuvA [Anaerolineaceae bacterium]|jgi:Holliday junction DNA helicase RuvA
MISSIEGIVTEKHPDHIVISINGLGIKVLVTTGLLQKIELHKTVGIFTNLVVREDSLTLYGFESKEEREMFSQLLSVSGVGPKTALAALSSGSIDLIKRAVINEQPELLGHLPGVGKKTAQGIVLHLQGKIEGEKAAGRGDHNEIDSDVIAALTGLGYSVVEAQAANQMLPEDTPDDLESRIRAALKYFS